MTVRDLSARRETTDGTRPAAGHLDVQLAAQYPLVAFALLRNGDLFDAAAGLSATSASLAAQHAIAQTVDFGDDATRFPELVTAIRRDMTRQLSGNPRLAARMAAAKPIRVDLVAHARDMVARGYPRSVARHAAGLFWDQPDWPHARIALRRDRLQSAEEQTLVFHEYAHAIHYLGFTRQERDWVADALRRVFAHPADQDEVFAIYSEREFLERDAFSALERAAPGVYGICRQQWSEDHAFAAFIKKLYRPTERVRAGDRERSAALKWKAFSGG